MRNIITSIGEVAGIGTVAVGIGMLSTPFGIIAAGVGLFAVAYRLGGDS